MNAPAARQELIRTLRVLWFATDGERAEALRHLEAQLAHSDEVKGHLAWYFLNHQQHNRALELYRALQRTYPADEEIERRIADCLLAEGHPDEAWETYVRLIARGTYRFIDEMEAVASAIRPVPRWAEWTSSYTARWCRQVASHPKSAVRAAREAVSLRGAAASIHERRPAHWMDYLWNYARWGHAWPAMDCDLCGSNQYETIYINRYSRIVRCTGCTLERALRVPPEGVDVAMAKYEDPGLFTKFESVWETPQWRNRRSEVLDRLLAPNVKSSDGPRHAFEIGAARGDMMILLRSLGWEIDGVESGEAFIKAAHEHHGLTLREGTLANMNDWPERQYDLVLAFHVIEHLDRPSRLFDAARRLLRPGGVFLLETPSSPLRDLGLAERCDINHGYLPLGHTHFYTPEPLKAMFPRCGFNLLGTHRIPLEQGFENMACIGTPE